jgi:N-glycosylase/DNA lyase
MKSICVENFDLSATLESGQVFRYIRTMKGYLVHQRSRVFQVCQSGDTLHFVGVETPFLIHYLGLHDEYELITRKLVSDKTMRKAIELYRGLRVLRQDLWECLISFLCSSTKSINHIKVILENLCRVFGEPISFGDYQGYTFPLEGRVDDLKRLQQIGLGFRAGYIYKVNRIVQNGYLERLVGEPYEEARGLLMSLPGVGEKIADCVLLFSMGFSQAFPIDTWIRRGMENTYFKGKTTSLKKIRVYAHQRFGPLAGYAQQYLYHYWREEAKSRRDKDGVEIG